MPRKDKVIHISNLPSTFRGNVTRNGRFIQNGISPLGGAYDKVAKSTGLIRLGNEFLYNGINNLVSKDNREKLMNNTAGRLINYVKDFNKESFSSDDELGPTFPFNIIQTPRSNGRNLPQKQYAVGGKIPNVVAGGIAQSLGNNFFYMNGRKHSQGGIDIGPSDKTGIEVEDGEVVETNGNELKVYSAQPIINGVSPAKLVMCGANPNKVFKAQEDFKDRNGINDDGTKAKYGKEKYVAKSDNTRVTPIMESPRNSGIKQGDFIYYPETYRIANNTLEKVPARKEVNMTPLEQVNPEFDILLGGAGVLRGVDKATKVAMALDKNISRTSQKAITKGRDALGYYSISPNIRYNLSVNNGRKGIDVNDPGIGVIFDNKNFKVVNYNNDMLGNDVVYQIPEQEVKDMYYKDINNQLGKLISNNYRKYVEKQFDKLYNKDINIELRKSKRISNNELKEYIKSKGIHPENKKYNVITSEMLHKTSRNKGNPYQHFIFTGDVGKQGLDVVDIKDVNSEEFKHIFNTRQHTGKYSKEYSRKSRKFGGKDMIVSISGNIKNGLIHSPSSTGGRHDKLIDDGRRTNPDSLKADRLWSDSQLNKIRYLTDLRNSTRNVIAPTNYKITDIHRTNEPGRYSLRANMPNQNRIDVNIPLNNLPSSNIPKGEEYINELIKIDNKNNNPQYYAERELPLFNDGPAITSGFVRAGWSHGNNNKKYNVDNINVPNVNITKSKGQTPRRGGNKQSQSVKSIPTKTPPIAVYNRNLPKVEASIPTTLPVSTNTPAKGTTSFDGKGQGKFKNLTTADWIGLGSNVAGSLASYFASKRAINKMRGPGRPTLISANKRKTKYNINPQLDRIREDKFEAYRDIDSNTASSRVSLARKQRVRNAAGQAANELYGNKENIETNLINQDRRNQQSVRQFNAQQYNQYIDRKAAFDNGIREAKVTNINNLFSGINAGIQDMISRYENRKALNNTISAMRASAPNVDDRIMRDAGVDYDEFIIRKRRKLGGKQSCR
nr:MAG: hypothetical protein [Bacteriophage sp.]